jgi:hypothetical protein
MAAMAARPAQSRPGPDHNTVSWLYGLVRLCSWCKRTGPLGTLSMYIALFLQASMKNIILDTWYINKLTLIPLGYKVYIFPLGFVAVYVPQSSDSSTTPLPATAYFDIHTESGVIRHFLSPFPSQTSEKSLKNVVRFIITRGFCTTTLSWVNAFKTPKKHSVWCLKEENSMNICLGSYFDV